MANGEFFFFDLSKLMTNSIYHSLPKTLKTTSRVSFVERLMRFFAVWRHVLSLGRRDTRRGASTSPALRASLLVRRELLVGVPSRLRGPFCRRTWGTHEVWRLQIKGRCRQYIDGKFANCDALLVQRSFPLACVSRRVSFDFVESLTCFLDKRLPNSILVSTLCCKEHGCRVLRLRTPV